MIIEALIKEMVELNNAQVRLRTRKVSVARLAHFYWGDKKKAISLLSEFYHRIQNNGEELRTTFNPNGFVKVQIAKVGRMSLRLHVFSPKFGIPEDGRVEENAHDHRWSLNSTLLCGKIVHTILGFSDLGETLYEYSYYPRGESNYFSMNDCGPKNLKTVKTIEPKPFRQLKLDSYVIHRAAYPAGRLTATLCLTDNDRRRPCNSIYARPEVSELIKASGGKTPAPFINEWTEDVVLEVLGQLLSDDWRF